MPDTALPSDNPKIPRDVKIAGATGLVILLVCLGFVISRPAQADPAPTVLAPPLTSVVSPALSPRLISAVAPALPPQLTIVVTAAPSTQLTSEIAPAPHPRLISVVAPVPTPQQTSMATAAPTPGIANPSPQRPVVTPPRGLSAFGNRAQVRRTARHNQRVRNVAEPSAGYMCPVALVSARGPVCNTSFRTTVPSMS